jgi:hypothetical protein
MLSREELLEREERAWAELVAELGRVPEHLRSEEGVVPGWSVNDLVYHTGKWAGVAAEKLGLLREGKPATSTSNDWRGKNDEWAAESKSLSFEDAMTSARRDREAAREALIAMFAVDREAEEWFTEETFDHYAEHTEEIARYADSLGVPEE